MLTKFSELKIGEQKDYFENYKIDTIENHIKKGNFFEFKCKSKKENFWTDDENCSCEFLVQKYFRERNMNVRTIYMWCRVSTKQQREKSTSLGLQRDTLTKFATLNYSSEDRFKVIQVSQTAFRKQSNELIDVIDNCKENDVILTYSVDRFSRNFELITSLLLKINEKGVILHSVKENLTYTPENKVDFFNKILIAQTESTNIGKRVKSALIYNRKNGRFGSKLPFGYRRSSDQTVTTDNEEQKQLTEIRKMFSKRNTVSNIKNHLNRNKIRRRGNPWTLDQVTNAVKTFDVDEIRKKISDMLSEGHRAKFIISYLNNNGIFWTTQLWDVPLLRKFMEQIKLN